MARLEGLKFTGSLGDFSAYRIKGSDEIYVRRKGGASKEKIMTSPRFVNTRKNISEFGGCSTMGKEVRRMMGTVKLLAGPKVSGDIVGLLKVVQQQDPVNDLGQRSIQLSKHPRLLEGFQMNELLTFDSIIRNTITGSIEKETGTARIDIPALMRDINFFPQNRHPLFRITVSLGIVPDFTFNEATKQFGSPSWYHTGLAPQEVSTAWHPAMEGSPATTLEVALKDLPAGSAYSLMLSIGISFGTLYNGGLIKQVKRMGAAKVLAVRGGNDPGMAAPHDGGVKKDTKPVEEVTPDSTKALKNKTDNNNAAIEAIERPALQYVYTLRQDAPVERTQAQVYTYTIERNAPEKQEVDVTAADIQRDVVKERVKSCDEVFPYKVKLQWPQVLADTAWWCERALGVTLSDRNKPFCAGLPPSLKLRRTKSVGKWDACIGRRTSGTPARWLAFDFS